MTSHHLPFYLAPGSGADVLLAVMRSFWLSLQSGWARYILRLHSLPERMARKSEQLQFEIVAIYWLFFAHPLDLDCGTIACADRYLRCRYAVAQHRKFNR
jgi:hypothetical protein